MAVEKTSGLNAKLSLLIVCLIGCVTLITYHPLLQTGFWADDYIFLERAGRMGFFEYMSQPSDLRASPMGAIRRPIFGLALWLEYKFFGSNANNYHVVNLVVHTLNCVMLFWLIYYVSRRRWLALTASLIYATLPLYSFAVFWVSDFSELAATLLYLSAVFLWFIYVQKKQKHFYILTLFCFLLALGTKETAITIPVSLFLLDSLMISRHVDVFGWIRRYILFVVITFLYLIQYSPASHLASKEFVILENLKRYLTLEFFPWTLESWVMGIEAWIILIPLSLVFIYIVYSRRDTDLGFLGLELVVLAVPFLPLWLDSRFFYLPSVISAIFIAAVFEKARQHVIPGSWTKVLFAFILGLIVAFDSQKVAVACSNYAALVRQDRQVLRQIIQLRPEFPKGSYLYFVNPPIPADFLSGMFFLQYGEGIRVSSNQSHQYARLSDFSVAYLYSFDEQLQITEVEIQRAGTQSLPIYPAVNYQAPIRFEGFEIAQDEVKRGAVFALLLYWRAMDRIDRDYTVFIHLTDESGQMVEGYDEQPGNGRSPTSSWEKGSLIVDARILQVPPQMPLGRYGLTMGLYYLPTQERILIVNQDGLPISDRMNLGMVDVIE